MKLFAAMGLAIGLMMSSNSLAQDEMTDFTFKDVDDKEYNTKDYRGKWVLFNYWGTYCPPCLDEIPDLIEFSEKHKDDAVVVGLDAGGTDIAGLKQFADDYFMNYTIAPAQESTLTAFGILVGIPTTFIVSPEGKVLEQVIGVIEPENVEKLMADYAKDKKKGG